ncbi:hypothetical protein [Kitasatospora cinereorecta]|uniref:Uncharacterized protein n=1 Tax=Kitasatospora cinereorecta TaxID=285560 RepID=A0ABW0VLM3_9ACTN
MAEVFDQELREQLDRARRELAAARAVGDDEGAEAYRGRIISLLRIARRHGIDLPHTPDEEIDD